MHYIYLFLDPDTFVHRYYGQGKGKRCNWWKQATKDWEFKYGVCSWLWKLKKAGKKPIVIIVHENLTQVEANNWEIFLIAMIGRVCKGTGSLLNIEDGGKNASRKLSAEPVIECL